MGPKTQSVLKSIGEGSREGFSRFVTAKLFRQGLITRENGFWAITEKGREALTAASK